MSWKVYEAHTGTKFCYEPDLMGRVVIIPIRGDTASTPITDLVEFVETVYHGSEIAEPEED